LGVRVQTNLIARLHAETCGEIILVARDRGSEALAGELIRKMERLSPAPLVEIRREVVVRVDEVGVVGVAALGVCGRTRGREKRE
jgi:hypothetical protein